MPGIDHHIAKPIRIADLEKLFPASRPLS